MNEKSQKQENSKWERKRERAMRPYTKEKFLFVAQGYLERFPSSVARFETVMERKFMRKKQPVEHGWIIEARDKALKDGFLNDELYGTSVRDSLDRKGLPIVQIKQKLTIKQLDREYISSLMSEIEDDSDAQKKRIMIYCKRKRLGPFLTRELEHDKHYARLRRAGFNHDVVEWVMQQNKDEVDIDL